MKDLLIRARIWTGDPDRPRAEAAVVSGGRFVFVGGYAEARAAYPEAEVADYGENMMMPGMSGKMKDIENAVDEKQLAHTEAIVHSMTPQERANPDLINVSRKQRIAKGAGLDIAEVNRFLKQFEQSRKMMKQLGGMGGKKGKRRRGMGNMFGGFGGGFPFS